MQNILVTGAAGGRGTRLRKLLKGVYPSIRWSDLRRGREPTRSTFDARRSHYFSSRDVYNAFGLRSANARPARIEG